MSANDIAPTIASVLCLAWVPGSFVAAFFLIRKPVQNTAGRVFLTLFLGLVFLIAGEVAVVAGCSSISPVNFK